MGYVETPDGQRYPQKTVISGVLRGILPDGYRVTAHFKSADVDPREESRAHCTLISDKARCIAGSVLELVSAFEKGVPVSYTHLIAGFGDEESAGVI